MHIEHISLREGVPWEEPPSQVAPWHTTELMMAFGGGGIKI